ncbi:MAG: hypothetical protein D3912_08045 [Candidatus Electrothrix sp. AX1]|nr:hypothetical protein [Candidatus Electrothrix sp. AX1]
MKIINPSYEVLDHLDQQSLAVRIELCGRICYKSEDRIDQDSALPFVTNMAEHGHNSVLEMGVVTLEITCTDQEQITDFFLLQPRYLQIDRTANILLVTGSIRSFRELLFFHPENVVVRAVCFLLNERHPYFFQDVVPKAGWASASDTPVTVRKVALDTVDCLPPERLLKHRYIAVKFIVNRAVTHEIVRHRPCSFLQECLSGDTVVKAFSGGRKWTMEELYRIFRQKNCGLARSKIRVRTKNSDGEIVPAKILSVVRSGKKELFKVTTKNGYSIKSSADHIYFTEYGERRLKDIAVGDRLMLNGKVISREWLKTEYLEKNRQCKDIAKEIGMSDAWLGKKIREFQLQKPKKMYPGRKPGHGVPGMHSEEEKRRISKRMSGEANHQWLGSDVSERGARSRLYRQDNASLHHCDCGKKAQEMHHIDRNPANNGTSNIEYCCVKCHKARHNDGAMVVWLDEIASIEPCGVDMTYDLEVNHPAHNFAANGFFVHNSQRYCRYSEDKFGSEVSFIKPMFFSKGSPEYMLWEKAMQETEQLYLQLLETSTPQAARTVLPNSCKTELIVYANLKEWQHIFHLRTTKAAEPSMREVMIPLQEDFQQRFPGSFP